MDNNIVLPEMEEHFPFVSPNPTNEQYHADKSRVSNSSLKVFTQSIPLYHQMFVTGEMEAKEATDAMSLGTVLHTLILEPHNADKCFAVEPEGINKRTNEGKAQYAKFLGDNKGKTLISTSDLSKAKKMAENVMKHQQAAYLINAEGMNEQTAYFKHPQTGIDCKFRMDCWRPNIGDGFILDIKTAADPLPEAWNKQSLNLGYHKQMAFYKEGMEIIREGVTPRFIFIVVGSSAPHEVVCYEMDERFESLGREINNRSLRELSRCMANDYWVGRHSKGVLQLEAPKYAVSDIQYKKWNIE